jgi:hypothetical protein
MMISRALTKKGYDITNSRDIKYFIDLFADLKYVKIVYQTYIKWRNLQTYCCVVFFLNYE